MQRLEFSSYNAPENRAFRLVGLVIAIFIVFALLMLTLNWAGYSAPPDDEASQKNDGTTSSRAQPEH